MCCKYAETGRNEWLTNQRNMVHEKLKKEQLATPTLNQGKCKGSYNTVSSGTRHSQKKKKKKESPGIPNIKKKVSFFSHHKEQITAFN